MQQLNSSTRSNITHWTLGQLAGSYNITHWTPGQLAASSIMGLCFLLGIPGNVAVVVFILRRLKADNFTVHLMLNLAAADILCLMTLPLWIYNFMGSWTLGRDFCKFSLLLVYCSVIASVLTVTLMSVQRYLQVLYPHQWAKLGRRGERALLLVLWALACAIGGPTAAAGEEEDRRDEARVCCFPMFTSDEHTVGVLLYETLLGFVVPFSIMVTSYFCLHKKVNQTTFFRDKRMTRLMTRIVVTFFIFWIPHHLLNLLNIFSVLLRSSHPGVSAKMSAFRKLSRTIVESLAIINSCVNPFLYAFASRSLRQSSEQPERLENRIQRANV